MEFLFSYSNTFFTRLNNIQIRITVPEKIFNVLHETKQIALAIPYLNDKHLKTYVFDIQETVTYYTAEEKTQNIRIPIEGMNLCFVLLWLIKQLGKPYDIIGQWTPIITKNAYHPAKLAMMAVAQVMPIHQPEKYSMKNVLEWSIINAI